MNTVAQMRDLTKKYGSVLALDNVSITLEKDKIYGLLGRNGAGKTTLMSILTAQGFKTSGTVEVFGMQPYENNKVLSRMCFIRESQRYPDDFTASQALKAASMFFENWSEGLASALVKDFQLPLKRRIKKLSRGQLSAVGVIIGLASRAELTFFDEPYLGLDAVARQLFYDRLIAEQAVHPRTIVLSSHLIDEVANLLEHVIVIERGRIVMNDDADSVRGQAFNVVGPANVVEQFVAGHEVLHTDRFASMASTTALGTLNAADRTRAIELGLELGPVSLQQLVVRKSLAAQEDEFAGKSPAQATMEMAS
ncbi:ABC transporter ATP-binding protein [Haematomicrobium sanguinis]|uniref:ABC transporter ATP-binding protein n=1 Tax=Haematomicrobium sanguinis TaxID=479106 RepID=UPI00068CF868|nr:ABC transporter ATP-binding protein [Haematomicrobium sanguinis]